MRRLIPRIAIAGLAVALSVPIGFAIGQGLQPGDGSGVGGIDPDVTPPIAINDPSFHAVPNPEPPEPKSGNVEGIIQIPNGPIDPGLVGDCQDVLERDPADASCRLTVAAANGDVQPGTYPQSRFDELMATGEAP